MKTKQTIVLLALLISTVAISQVGIGTITPHDSAILDVESTTKGFLPTRLSNEERNDIANLSPGLVIYNTTEKCLQFYNNTVWYSACSGLISPDPILGELFTNGFEGNSTCIPKLISVTPCAAVNGAILNDDITTAEGIEYDWIGATDFVSGGTTRALVDIGGQCWYRRNAINVPTGGTGNAAFFNNAGSEPAPGEGRLYSWSKAMNGATGAAAERAQGLCPTGWHVPSDCEVMYLERSIGMTVAQQGATNERGNLAGELSALVPSASNSTGFTFLLSGARTASGYAFRNDRGFFWTSSQTSATSAYRRLIQSGQQGINRATLTKTNDYPVRCLKD